MKLKKEYLIGLVIGVTITLIALLGPKILNSTTEFKWNAKERGYDSLQAVTFTNGAQLIYSDPDKGFGVKKILLRDSGGASKTYLEDDHVYINAAYPDAQNAQVAIVSNTCGGSACGYPSTYMILPEKSALKKYLISSRDTYQLLVELNKGGLVSAQATNVILGTDEFGSNTMGSIDYLKDKGFLLKNMKAEYKPLIDEHPINYFDDKVAREPLAKLIGLDKFRDLRENMMVASTSRLLDYRYLVLIGCMPHNCMDSYGAVVIDTTNNNLWWVSVVDGKYDSGSNVQLTTTQIPLYKDLFERIDLREGFKLTLSNAGKFIVAPRTSYSIRGLE